MPKVDIDEQEFKILEFMAKDEEMEVEAFINQVLRDYLGGLGMLPRVIPR